jgi:hypothetical protein
MFIIIVYHFLSFYASLSPFPHHFPMVSPRFPYETLRCVNAAACGPRSTGAAGASKGCQRQSADQLSEPGKIDKTKE